MPLACPSGITSGDIDVEFYEAPPSAFHHATRARSERPSPERWFTHVVLPDGTDYLTWSGLSEFLVSPDGRSIAFRPLKKASLESFQTYLVSQTLSFALLKQGIEPLHATAVVLDGRAVAFLGDCGYGKSSLGAAFVQTGHRLLTDDVLVVSRDPAQHHRMLAHPGPPRLKLFPRVASRLLNRHQSGTPLNWGTRKLILPLTHDEHCDTATPLETIYVLGQPASRPPSTQVTIRTLPLRRACLKLIANTFNTVITDQARLARQFNWAAQLASTVPVKSLSYPRRLSHIPAVLAAIHKDLAQ